MSQIAKKLSCMGIVLLKCAESDLEVLLIENDGEMVFPKGHVEREEAHTAAAIREIFEETGVRVQFADYRGKIDQFEFYFDGEKAIKVIEVHLFQLATRQDPKPNLAEGISKAYWHPSAKALVDLTHDDAREALRKAIARAGY